MITFEDVEKELLRKYKMTETLSVENLENFVNKTKKSFKPKFNNISHKGS